MREDEDRAESELKERARQLGFERCGIAPSTPADGFERLQEWLARGYAGEMTYMGSLAEARRDPISILPDVKSVVMLAMTGGRERTAQRLSEVLTSSGFGEPRVIPTEGRLRIVEAPAV